MKIVNDPLLFEAEHFRLYFHRPFCLLDLGPAKIGNTQDLSIASLFGRLLQEIVNLGEYILARENLVEK